MNGFEQIKSFYSWVFNNPDKVKTTHISLYLFLLNQNNRSMWVEWFKCPYDLAMQGACIGSKTTYYKSLKDLQEFGLIEYKEGLNNYKSPLVKLICLYKSVPLSEQASVPLSEQVSVQLPVQLSGHIYKLITNNIKLITDNQDKFELFIKSLSEGCEVKPKLKKSINPSKEDVISFFVENGYKESSAIKAFDYYNDGQWTDSNGKKVVNWKQKMRIVWFKDEHRFVDSKDILPDNVVVWKDGIKRVKTPF